METVNPGYGYRLIGDGDTIQNGDEWLDGNGWVKRSVAFGCQFRNAWAITRRKINVGEGYELVPESELGVCAKMEHTFDGTMWQSTAGTGSGRRPIGTSAVIAFRRRIKTSDWIDIKTVRPDTNSRVWFQHTDGRVMLCNDYTGIHTHWKCWRPVKAGEIPEPPAAPVAPPKSQAELDAEASAEWYRSGSDREDALCEQALRLAYEAGLQKGRESR